MVPEGAEMLTRPKHVHACPECGAAVSRVHRHLGDRLIGLFQSVHRYRCTNPGCGWEGIVSRPSLPALAGGGSATSWSARLLWMTVGAALALAVVGGIRLHRNPGPAKAPLAASEIATEVPVPAGESFDGLILPDNDVRVAGNPSSDLSLRRGCAWGVPGRSPYQGTVAQALSGARLPQEVVHKIEAMVERGVVSDRVEITRDSIHTTSGKRRFDPTIVAMGFGNNLCFGTRVNFHPGHVERADLYDATDAAGTNFAVMVPYVCGNVSVLAERAERPDGGTSGNGRTVPEPGTVWSVAMALAALAAATQLPHRRGSSGRQDRCEDAPES